MFGRKKTSATSRSAPNVPKRFPPDMVGWLETNGRFYWQPQVNPMPEHRAADFYFQVQEDRDGFLRDLAAVAIPAGGWAAYGGKCLAMDIISLHTDTPDFNAVIRAGFDFLRKNYVPPNRLSINDRKMWERVRREDEPWLVWRERPADTLTPLQPGEERKIIENPTADGYVGKTYVKLGDDGKCYAETEGWKSEDDHAMVRRDWTSEPTLHQLYIRIGEIIQIPPQWAADEFEPYIPLPAMTI